jgi:hypothetical protein
MASQLWGTTAKAKALPRRQDLLVEVLGVGAEVVVEAAAIGQTAGLPEKREISTTS